MSSAKFNVVVVGGGFSGAMLAIRLLRLAPNLSVAVVDRGAVPGRGLAYSTKYDCHLLNVPAGSMSALPEEPDHFLCWARANYLRSVQATSFLPRLVYGRYVGSLLDETIANHADKFRWIQGEAFSFTQEGTQTNIRLKDGSELIADAMVLALGNFPPADLKIPGLTASSKRYFPSAWSAGGLRDVPRNGEVLLIGSGLTSIDVAVALKAEGFAGHIHILSRRGLIPQPHRKTGPWAQFWNEQSPRTIRGLLRLVREQILAASEAGIDWRAVIDALRPETQAIWQSLPFKERKRFLRHVRSYWEVHRHRIAPEIGSTLAKLIHDGRASLYAGRITTYREFHDHAEIGLQDRKTRSERLLHVDRVINCTGPETDYRRINDSLIRSLVAQGFARPDALFLGLDVDVSGALIDSSGMSFSSLYVIGPARKGSLWETIAVPELRMQAAELAEHLAGRFGPHIFGPHARDTDGERLRLRLESLRTKTDPAIPAKKT